MPIADMLTWIGLIAGALIALGVIWTKGLRPLYRFLRRVEDVHRLIIDELPAFMQETREWQAAKDPILKQLQPNSGSSMFDRVRRIEEQLNSTGPNAVVNISTVETRGGDVAQS